MAKVYEATLKNETEPLCGWEWFEKHKSDYTQEYIDSLGIVVTCDGKELPPVVNSKSLRQDLKILKEEK